MRTSQQITLVQLNDTHGYLDPHPEQFWAGGRAEFRNAGGYGRIAGLLQQIRRETGGQMIVLDCGDTLHGTYAPVATRGEVMLPILERMGFAAMIAHWDFAYGPKRLQEIACRLPYPEVAATVDNAMAPYREKLAEVVGETRTALMRGRVLEATMDNFILQSLLHSSEAEIAFSHGWRYGAPVPPGPVTLGDLYQIIPMDPPIFTAEIRGEALWDMLEENLHNVFAADPYEQIGGSVKRGLGLNAYIRPENPRGHRLCELFINGELVEPSRSYRVVFVTTQAVPEQYVEKREKLGLSAVEALRRYLADKGPVAAPLRDTFVAI